MNAVSNLTLTGWYNVLTKTGVTESLWNELKTMHDTNNRNEMQSYLKSCC